MLVAFGICDFPTGMLLFCECFVLILILYMPFRNASLPKAEQESERDVPENILVVVLYKYTCSF